MLNSWLRHGYLYRLGHRWGIIQLGQEDAFVGRQKEAMPADLAVSQPCENEMMPGIIMIAMSSGC
jgi:hypothetical protein